MGPEFPSIPFTFTDVITIGTITGIPSGLSVILLTCWSKKRGLPWSLIGNSISLGVFNFGGLALFKPLKPSIGPFFFGEFLAVLIVVLSSSYFIFKKANLEFPASLNSLKLMHERLLETFRFFSSALVTSATGGVIALLILSYEVFPIEVITGKHFTRFIGIHLLFGGYVLFGFFMGCVWQILRMCGEIERRLDRLSE